MNNTFIVDDSDQDDLNRLLKDQRRNTRHDIWLWLYLQEYKEAKLDPTSCNGSTMRNTIARFLRQNTNILKTINSEKDQSLVPDNHLKWIEEDERQYQWLLHRIEDIVNLNPFQRPPLGFIHLTGRNHLIAMLDIWDADIAEKARKIETLRNSWLTHKSMDSDFEWFEDKKDGSKRCKCAWDWLKKNHHRSLSRRQPISNYKELLMFFDREDFGQHERKAIIQSIKRRWSRKKFDERTDDKKQVNTLLKKDAIELLDQLAEQSGMKRAQILETLIRKEFDQKLYLTD